MEVSLLTFNTGLLRLAPFGRTALEPAPCVEARARALPAALRAIDADIVCLQEIYAARHRRALATALADLYPHAISPRRGAKILPSGLMLLSKFAVAAHRFRGFRAGPFEERWFVQKGFQETIFRAPDRPPLHVLNLHATAGGWSFDPEDPRADAIRARQIDQVLAAADAQAGAALTLIVGDLNAGPPVSMGNYAQFGKAAWVDLYARRHGMDAAGTTWSGDHPLARNGPHSHQRPQRIDHVFARDGAVSVLDARIVLQEPVVAVPNDAPVGLSDHFGVLVKLRAV
ncbi:MAG: endonuclease/exonuclease/phosphatase family protein [Alphaproteobacteria bacterium]